MKILILGGTSFIGLNLVERLISDDQHEITLFNRGKTGKELFPNVARISGDRRSSDIEQVKSDWDVVVDVSCYFPADLESALAQLDPTRTRYIFISTCSVYEPDTAAHLSDENAQVCSCTAADRDDPSTATYGNRKAECERVLERSGFKNAVLRPALVYGQYDPTDRLYYWLYQTKTKDRVLIPDNGERRFSITYVYDLVEAISKLINSEITGTFNAISVPETSIGEIVSLASASFGSTPELINATPEFLNQQKIAQWTDMPLWINGDHFTYANEKLRSELGIETSSMVDGIHQTIAYYDSLDWPVPSYGMAEEKRQELLSALTR